MIVSRWVSSKSSRLAEIALTNAAPIASSCSGRPMIADVAAPLNGNSVRSAAMTAGSCAEPSAVAKKFRIERFASWLCAATSVHTVPATKSASVVLAPCASSCRTERIPRILFSRPYSGATWPVDRNLMLDRLTDNLEIRRNATGEPWRDKNKKALAARQGANHGSRNNRLCRHGPHGWTDGRTFARRRLFAVHLRFAERGDQGAGCARRTACEIAR